ncbi:hypothetical protein CC78DRAFT_534092 [Lojkania enalia]|uniref:Glutamine amidotransferase type-2 domain-containing protein n=1 Tax=Lojkania enalia TaxID=147567 RepID=A0A9P4K7Q6_9PLEO|nr:hypothetical protein CC78DRAFT_534092 [Didymosphaeria enalia]
MCGIFFSLSRNNYLVPDPKTENLLKNRGPDCFGKHQRVIAHNPALESRSDQFHALFLSTVLSLRGHSIVEQPLRDDASDSILCWNGEAWRIGPRAILGNDSEEVFRTLLERTDDIAIEHRTTSIERVLEVIASIRGPFAFVFLDAKRGYLYYGRDCLGRRSLLRKSSSADEFVLSSVCDNASDGRWEEVDADGLYVVDLNTSLNQTGLEVIHIPHCRLNSTRSNGLSIALPFPLMNAAAPDGLCNPNSEHVAQLRTALNDSLRLRVQHVRESVMPIDVNIAKNDAKIAILFSGGLDCTVLARLAHDLVPLTESIDLLNVAFENPRVHGKLDQGVSPYELCPDRITGRTSYAELLQVCPGRLWHFVEINVPYAETSARRARVVALMHPHNTEMDLSISFALYFASRGSGLACSPSYAPPSAYTTPAHVLLSGLGADELFGGYQRHAIAFSRQGYAGLIDELVVDFDRLGKRNLGRDDRVISDSGKEVRFPYLDENFIALALKFPVWAKCDFENAQLLDSDDPSRFLEPGKRILRLLAWHLDMKGVAKEKKRAIQFGSRTAKMETGKTKGTQQLS